MQSLFIAMLLFAGQTGSQGKNKPNTAATNKQTVLKIYEALNLRKLEALNNLIADEFAGPGGIVGAEGFKTRVRPLVEAFPDARWVIEEVIAEEKKVLIRWTFQGTHSGAFLGIPPTGIPVSNDGLGIYELKDGKVIKAAVYTDRLGFLQTLKVVQEDITQLVEKSADANYIRFIDKFVVPSDAKVEFMERVRINRDFIKNLPGFVEDAAYESSDGQGNLIFITVAVWKDQQALENAKEAVQIRYREEGFAISEMMKRLNIRMERGVYRKTGS